MSEIFSPESGRTVVVPLDDSLLAGPEGGLLDLEAKVNQVVDGGANAVMGFRGLFRRNSQTLSKVAAILNVTASTTLGAHTRKVAVGTVEEALQVGAAAIAVHVNVGSKFEHEMLRILGEFGRQCERFDLPLLALMYPRSERDGADYNFEDVRKSHPGQYSAIVRHAVRIGVDLGADIVKTTFTGDEESFETVVRASSGVPLVTAGGPLVSPEKMLSNAFQAIRAGARGLSFGRNVFNRTDSSRYIEALRQVAHRGFTDVEALVAVSGKVPAEAPE